MHFYIGKTLLRGANAAAIEHPQRGSRDDLVKRDKVNLDIFWLKDESLEDSANLDAEWRTVMAWADNELEANDPKGSTS